MLAIGGAASGHFGRVLTLHSAVSPIGRCGEMRPRELAKPSLRVRLGLLVAGTTLPLIIFAGGVIFQDYIHDRNQANQRVLETARNIRFTLDAEIRRMSGGLQVLALTNALRSGDFN